MPPSLVATRRGRSRTAKSPSRGNCLSRRCTGRCFTSRRLDDRPSRLVQPARSFSVSRISMRMLSISSTRPMLAASMTESRGCRPEYPGPPSPCRSRERSSAWIRAEASRSCALRMRTARTLPARWLRVAVLSRSSSTSSRVAKFFSSIPIMVSPTRCQVRYRISATVRATEQTTSRARRRRRLAFMPPPRHGRGPSGRGAAVSCAGLPG